MEGNGPILGRRNMRALSSPALTPPSVDATCCQIMKIDPAKIHYLTCCREIRLALESVKQTGESIAAVRVALLRCTRTCDYLRLNKHFFVGGDVFHRRPATPAQLENAVRIPADVP